MTGARINVTGLVQGVGYRWFCHQKATALSLVGWVKNEPDHSVTLHVEGEKSTIEALIALLRLGPSHAEVEQVNIEWLPYTGKFTSFEITR